MNDRTFGLVWENQTEGRYNEFLGGFPILKSRIEIINKCNNVNHILIEVNNLFSLAGLQYIHMSEMQEGI